MSRDQIEISEKAQKSQRARSIFSELSNSKEIP
jgi:hypothetical protein